MPSPGSIRPRNLTSPNQFSKRPGKMASDENFLFGVTAEEKMGMNTFFYKFEEKSATPVDIWSTLGMINWPEIRQITKPTDARYAPSETSDVKLLWERMKAILDWDRTKLLNNAYILTNRKIWARIQMRYRKISGGRSDKLSICPSVPIFGFLGPAFRINKVTGKSEPVGGASLPKGWYYCPTSSSVIRINDEAGLENALMQVTKRYGTLKLNEAKGAKEATNDFQRWCNGISDRIASAHEKLVNVVDDNFYIDESKFMPIHNEEEYDKAVEEVSKVAKDVEQYADTMDNIGDKDTAMELESLGKGIRKAEKILRNKTKYAFTALDIINENKTPAVDKRSFISATLDLSKAPNTIDGIAKTLSENYEDFDPEDFDEGAGRGPKQLWDSKAVMECGIFNFLDNCHNLRDDLAGTRDCSSFGQSEADLADKCREMASTLLVIAANLDREI